MCGRFLTVYSITLGGLLDSTGIPWGIIILALHKFIGAGVMLAACFAVTRAIFPAPDHPPPPAPQPPDFIPDLELQLQIGFL